MKYPICLFSALTVVAAATGAVVLVLLSFLSIRNGKQKPQASYLKKKKKMKKKKKETNAKKYTSNIVLSVHVRDRKLYHQLEAADRRKQ